MGGLRLPLRSSSRRSVTECGAWLDSTPRWIRSRAVGRGAGGSVPKAKRALEQQAGACSRGAGAGGSCHQDLSAEQTASRAATAQLRVRWCWGPSILGPGSSPSVEVTSDTTHHKCPELLSQTRRDPSDAHCGDVKWALALGSEVWAPVLAPGLRSLVLWDQ